MYFLHTQNVNKIYGEFAYLFAKKRKKKKEEKTMRESSKCRQNWGSNINIKYVQCNYIYSYSLYSQMSAGCWGVCVYVWCILIVCLEWPNLNYYFFCFFFLVFAFGNGMRSFHRNYARNACKYGIAHILLPSTKWNDQK